MQISPTKAPIHAVYSNGQLRLLDPVELVEGQEIQLVILSERERLHAALQTVRAEPSTAPILSPAQERALMQEIERAFQGQPPLSEMIIEERRTGR